MIKVGILGAETPEAGELIRILKLHPETELSLLFSPELSGHKVTYFHHGLIGDDDLTFSSKIDFNGLDLLIGTNEIGSLNQIIENFLEKDNSKLILFPGIQIQHDDTDIHTGLSEINRKTLVREASVARLTSTAASPILITLAPLARYLLLNSEINIEITLPADQWEKVNAGLLKEEIEEIIKKFQSSYSGTIILTKIPDSFSERSISVKIKMKNTLQLQDIKRIYDEIYDDHNFSFVTTSEINKSDVAGTHNVLISLSKPDPDTLEITTVADSRMRGGAGDAVHVMNLFFGLHEKTGLEMKASNFFKR